MSQPEDKPEDEPEAPVTEVIPVRLRCSACGSDAPHHLDYVAKHGLCVV